MVGVLVVTWGPWQGSGVGVGGWPPSLRSLCPRRPIPFFNVLPPLRDAGGCRPCCCISAGGAPERSAHKPPPRPQRPLLPTRIPRRAGEVSPRQIGTPRVQRGETDLSLAMVSRCRASQVALLVKNPPANAVIQETRFDPWVGEIPWRRSWQLSLAFLTVNPMDRGVLRAAIRRLPKGRQDGRDSAPRMHHAIVALASRPGRDLSGDDSSQRRRLWNGGGRACGHPRGRGRACGAVPASEPPALSA